MLLMGCFQHHRDIHWAPRCSLGNLHEFSTDWACSLPSRCWSHSYLLREASAAIPSPAASRCSASRLFMMMWYLVYPQQRRFGPRKKTRLQGIAMNVVRLHSMARLRQNRWVHVAKEYSRSLKPLWYVGVDPTRSTSVPRNGIVTVPNKKFSCRHPFNCILTCSSIDSYCLHFRMWCFAFRRQRFQ